MWQCPMPAALPGPGPAAGAEQQEGSSWDAVKEEEGKNTSSLVLVWPCGSCVITFQ